MLVAKEIFTILPEFCQGVPYQIKKIAVKDACEALTINKKKAKQTGKPFTLHFKSRKNPTQSCFIPKTAISIKGIYSRISGAGLHYAETLPADLCDSRLVYCNGRYYLAVPHDKKTTLSENQGRVVAIDPGVRSFITFYSEASLGQLGRHDIGRIQRLCAHLDNLLSRAATATAKQRAKQLYRAAKRIRWKIRDLVDELHHKTARFLCDTFDIILLPTFETQQMVLKGARKLRRKSVRHLLTWAHYRFKQFLKHKAFELGKVVLDVNEAYTSKTNSWTGEIMSIGGQEQIAIENIRINRDINGARGILLRALVDSPSLRVCVQEECVVNES